MSDYQEHNPNDHEDPSPASTWMIGFISTVLFVVTFFGLVALYYGAREKTDSEQETALKALERQREREQKPPLEALAALEWEQKARLNAPPHWVLMRSGGREVERRLVVPIDDAMDRIVEDMSR